MPALASSAARFWAIVLGAGALSGGLFLLVTFGSLGVLVLVYIAQLPLFLVGLSLGLTASVAAGLAGAVTTIVVGPAATRWLLMALYAAMMLGPVWVIVRQALLSRRNEAGETEWYPPGLLTGWLVGAGIAMVLGAGFALMLLGGAEQVVRETVGQVFDAIQAMIPQSARFAERDRVVAEVAGYLPGTSVASLLVMTVVNAALAQGVLVRFEWNRRPTPDIAALDLPVTLVAVFAASVALGVLLPGDLGYIARNVAPVVLVGAVLAGLAVVHSVVRRFDGRSWMLIAVYVATMLIMWPVFMLAALGLAEPFVKVRRRLAGRV